MDVHHPQLAIGFRQHLDDRITNLPEITARLGSLQAFLLRWSQDLPVLGSQTLEVLTEAKV